MQQMDEHQKELVERYNSWTPEEQALWRKAVHQLEQDGRIEPYSHLFPEPNQK
jgi:hypothetical protein